MIDISKLIIIVKNYNNHHDVVFPITNFNIQTSFSNDLSATILTVYREYLGPSSIFTEGTLPRFERWIDANTINEFKIYLSSLLNPLEFPKDIDTNIEKE